MGKTLTRVLDDQLNAIGWVTYSDTSDTFPDGFAATKQRLEYEERQGLTSSRQCVCGGDAIDGFLYQPYVGRYVNAQICPHCRVILPGDWLAPFGCGEDEHRRLWINGHPSDGDRKGK